MKLVTREIYIITVGIFGSLFAGFVNGLLGTAGGILMTFVYSQMKYSKDRSTKDSLVSAMATILPISFFSLMTYSSDYLKNITFLLAVAVPAAAGGLLGALVGTKVKTVFLEKIFAVLIIYAGINMIF